jgi:hypothetical protein
LKQAERLRHSASGNNEQNVEFRCEAGDTHLREEALVTDRAPSFAEKLEGRPAFPAQLTSSLANSRKKRRGCNTRHTGKDLVA